MKYINEKYKVWKTYKERNLRRGSNEKKYKRNEKERTGQKKKTDKQTDK